MFNQEPPALGHAFDADRLLRSHLSFRLSREVMDAASPGLSAMGALTIELAQQQQSERKVEPELTTWDAWGNRVDHIALTPLWQRAEGVAAEEGLVALAYERPYGVASRIVQMALVHLFHPVTDVYSCPLAMTDGAARTLVASGNQELQARALPHLLSRVPSQFWTSGQWMTETTGGSDVGRTETTAHRDASGSWTLEGRKWFTSAATSQMALTLARPVGNPPGGKGLALFYVEPRDDRGRLAGIEILRLKDKLGTRKLPTAELALVGTPATLVGDTNNGIAAISPMLQVTRTWNAVCGTAIMVRSLLLAENYAQRRQVFGRLLADQPLHRDTLEGLWSEAALALQLSQCSVRLLAEFEATGSSETSALQRLVSALAKLVTGRQAVEVVSEAIEVFGGAGYVEDTGLPTLLRDAHVIPIWEGTTDVLSLESLRAMASGQALPLLREVVARAAAAVSEVELVKAGAVALGRIDSWTDRLLASHAEGRDVVEANARRISLGLGRALALALLVEEAQHHLNSGNDWHRRLALRAVATI